MAHTVVVFGAGASRSTGAPLTADFIDKAYELSRRRSEQLSFADFEVVFSLINERLQDLYAKSVVDLDNIESIFGLVEMGRLIGKLPRTPADEVEAAARSMRCVLTQTIEHYCGFPFDGSTLKPNESYGRLAAVVGDRQSRGEGGQFAFITFNYDIALEFALGYESVDYSYGLTEILAHEIPLLKLHGSLNWSGCGCGAIQEYPVARWLQQHPYRGASGLRSVPISQHLGDIPRHCEKAPHLAEPAIVPPSWNKTQYHGQVGRVWRQAALELSEAERIIVVGYSMPESDSFFRDLLALGISGASRLREFMVVNPDPAVANRFQALLGPSTRKRFRAYSDSFESWLNVFAQQNAQRS